jgi:5-methylcytosine-specific restriction endonuclease McrA
LQIKIDPGSKTTGIALVSELEGRQKVLSLFELTHRGQLISKKLTARRQMRRRRRGNLRYRAPRFLNRGNKAEGWLAPSLQHRVDTTASWVGRLMRLAPVTGIAQELVRFDMQQLETPDIRGIEYQQGTLAGFEVREYLLEKWGRECAYCGTKEVPLEIEHIHPRSRGGSDRISNLTLACQPCNQKKGAQDIETFLARDQARLTRIVRQAKKPLKDAAAVNSTRWSLLSALKETRLPVTTGSGGLTKYNRSRLSIPKTHALDAVCVGATEAVSDWQKPTLAIKCTGRGQYRRTTLSAYGFPRGYLTRQKRIKGFQTGDTVKADVSKGKKTGCYTGRVVVRASGSFNIQTATGVVQGIGYRCCKIIQRADGYGYQFNTLDSYQEGGVAGTGRAVHDALSLPGMNARPSVPV